MDQLMMGKHHVSRLPLLLRHCGRNIRAAVVAEQKVVAGTVQHKHALPCLDLATFLLI